MPARCRTAAALRHAVLCCSTLDTWRLLGLLSAHSKHGPKVMMAQGHTLATIGCMHVPCEAKTPCTSILSESSLHHQWYERPTVHAQHAHMQVAVPKQHMVLVGTEARLEGCV
jgi:hypothetical protein